MANLAEKGGAEIHDESFVGVGDVSGDFHDGRRADGEKEAGDVDKFGLLYQRPTGGLVDVVESEGVGRRQVGHQRSVLSSLRHDHGARPFICFF